MQGSAVVDSCVDRDGKPTAGLSKLVNLSTDEPMQYSAMLVEIQAHASITQRGAPSQRHGIPACLDKV